MLDPAIKARLPKYVRDGQTIVARRNFVEGLELQQTPVERFWRFQTGSEKDFQRIIDGDKRYDKLLVQPPQFISWIK